MVKHIRRNNPSASKTKEYKMYKMNKRIKEIIEDILKKRPTANGCSLSTEHYYDYERRYHRARIISDKEFFGYDPIELYELGFRNPGRCRLMLEELYTKGITRKLNRLDERLLIPVRAFVNNNGIPGVYRVFTSDERLGLIYAADRNEARRIADVTFGYLVLNKTDRYGAEARLFVRFESIGDISSVSVENEKAIEALKRKMNGLKTTAEGIAKNIADTETLITAIQLSALSQLSATFESVT